MRERFRLRILTSAISLLMLLAILACALLFEGSFPEPTFQGKGLAAPGPTEIRDPEIALKYGITGYLEITYPPDSPSLLLADRGGEINIEILLHLVSYTPDFTQLHVHIDSKDSWRYTIQFGDFILNELVSYNPSGDVLIKAGETIPVTMTVRIPEDLPWYTTSIPLGAVGITANVEIISELGKKEVVIR